MASCLVTLHSVHSTSTAVSGGGSASPGKPLGLHTLNYPLFSNGPPGMMNDACSVVQDVTFKTLINVARS